MVQAKWLQKTAEEIRQFGVDEALCRCLLLEASSLRAWTAGQFLGPGGLGNGELRRQGAEHCRDFEAERREGLRAPEVDFERLVEAL